MHIPNVVQIVGSIWVHTDQMGTHKKHGNDKDPVFIIDEKACDCIDASERLRKRKGESTQLGDCRHS